jgi:photosystem II stability/assembly factor-like uncharacterized protein
VGHPVAGPDRLAEVVNVIQHETVDSRRTDGGWTASRPPQQEVAGRLLEWYNRVEHLKLSRGWGSAMRRSSFTVFALTVCIASFVSFPLHAEPRWSWQNPQPTGSTLRAITFLDISTVVAVGDGGTVIRSGDAGLTWTDIDTRTGLYIRDVSFGTTSIGLAVGSRGVVLRTSDGGVRWDFAPSPTTGELFHVFLLDGATGFLSDYDNLIRTDDGGATWQTRAFPPEFAVADFWVFNINRIVAVGGIVDWDTGNMTAAIYLTTDGGLTWSNQYVGAYLSDLRSVSFSDAMNGTATGNPGTVVRTTDSGLTWSAQPVPTQQILEAVVQIDSARAIAVGYGGRIIRTSDGGSSWTISVSNTDRALHGVASNGAVSLTVGENGIILRSTDDGASWDQISRSFTYNGIYGVYFLDSLHGTVVGDAGSIFRTEDGGVSWTSQTSGITSRLRGVYFTDSDHGHAVGDDGYILRTNDGGSTWISRSRDTTLPLYSVSFEDAQTGYIAGWNKVYKTSDGGVTWISQTNAPLSLYTDVCAVDGTATIVGWVQELIRTTDGGATWVRRAPPWRQTYNAVFFFDANTGVVVGDNGTIVRTTDGCNTWTLVQTGTHRNLNEVWFSNSLNGTAVGEWGDIRFTTDGGFTWKWQRSGMEGSYLGDIFGICMTGVDTGTMVGSGGAILRREPEQTVAVFFNSFAGAATPNGAQLLWSVQTDDWLTGFRVNRSQRDGLEFEPILLDPEARSYIDKTVQPGFTYTYTLEALAVSGSFLSAPVEVSMPPLQAALLQNRPNPFNPVTRIPYIVPVSSLATLRVYATDGSLVRTLVNRMTPAGAHEAFWDGRDDSGKPVASGIYFYQLNTGKTTLSRKMLLLK